MSEQPAIEQPEVQRINGFAVGDRVAIVNCELAGAYGKVEHSAGGCEPWWCRDDCRLVFVELSHVPAGVDPAQLLNRRWWLNDRVHRFLVSEVTHVD